MENLTLSEIQKKLRDSRSKINETNYDLRNNLLYHGRGKMNYKRNYEPFESQNKVTYHYDIPIDNPTKRSAPPVSEIEGKRNKRLLGSLMNHLNKAKKILKEDVTINLQNNRQKEVFDKTVQEESEKKSEYMRQEREKFNKIKNERLVNLLENDKAQTELLFFKLKQHYEGCKKYSLTKSEPRIFYKPNSDVDSEFCVEWINERQGTMFEIKKNMLEKLETLFNERKQRLADKIAENEERNADPKDESEEEIEHIGDE